MGTTFNSRHSPIKSKLVCFNADAAVVEMSKQTTAPQINSHWQMWPSEAAPVNLGLKYLSTTFKSYVSGSKNFYNKNLIYKKA